MGRTSSKIEKKIEDLLASNPVPKSATNKVKKIAHAIKKSDLNIMNKYDSKKAKLAVPESISDEYCDDSLMEFSDKICNDSGFFEEALTASNSGKQDNEVEDMIYDVSMSDASSNILDSSYDAQEDQVQVCPEMLPLRPLYFEVPGRDPLMNRMDVMKEIFAVLRSKKNRGLVLAGKSGAGKTSIILNMVQQSYFGGCLSKSDSFFGNIVGYHFIQSADPATMDAAKFLHSLAAQLTQHPALRSYRDLLLSSPQLVSMLSLKKIRENPNIALKRAILDPLRDLYRENKIELDEAVILVDGLDQEPKQTIAKLIATNILRFPNWLKLILTSRTCDEEMVKLTHLPVIDLENYSDEDISAYVEERIFNTQSIMTHIVNNHKQRKNFLLVKLVEFITQHSDGSFLFPKMFLDLISIGFITIKSTNFKNLPQNTSECLQLLMNILFPTPASYTSISQVLSLCLASPRPLFMPQIKRLLSSSTESKQPIQLDYKRLAHIMMTRSDGSLMFFHQEIVNWLTSDVATRFKVNVTDGHDMFIKYYNSIDILHTSEALDFIHHLANTSLFKHQENEEKEESNYISKFVYLTYKVDQKLLIKCGRVINFHSFITDNSISLLNLALGSKKSNSESFD